MRTPQSRASAPIHQLQEHPPATSTKDWWYWAGGGRAQVSHYRGFALSPHSEILLGLNPGLCHGASTASDILSIYKANIFFFFRLVIETLDPLAADRKCFRMVNGVLVERTVKDVLPTLKTNSDGLKQVLEDMLKQYKSKQGELDTWKVSTSPVSWLFPGLKPYPGNLIRTMLTLISPLQKKNNIQVVQP